MDDTVNIDIECNFDLRYASSCRGNTVKDECAEGLVVGCHRSFTLQDMDIYSRLVIGSGGEYL